MYNLCYFLGYGRHRFTARTRHPARRLRIQAGGGDRLLARGGQQGQAARRGLAPDGAGAASLHRRGRAGLGAAAPIVGAAAGCADPGSADRRCDAPNAGALRQRTRAVSAIPCPSFSRCPSRRSLPHAATDRCRSRSLEAGEPRHGLRLAPMPAWRIGRTNRRRPQRGDVMALSTDDEDRPAWARAGSRSNCQASPGARDGLRS